MTTYKDIVLKHNAVVAYPMDVTAAKTSFDFSSEAEQGARYLAAAHWDRDNNNIWSYVRGNGVWGAMGLVNIVDPGGNFDMQIDYTHTLEAVQAYHYIRLAMTSISGNTFWVEDTWQTQRVYRSNFYDGTDDIQSTGLLGTDNPKSGKLRIARVGSTFTAYYWNGSGWTTVHAYTETPTTEPYFPVVYHISDGTAYPTSTCTFDNWQLTGSINQCYLNEAHANTTFDTGVNDLVAVNMTAEPAGIGAAGMLANEKSRTCVDFDSTQSEYVRYGWRNHKLNEGLTVSMLVNADTSPAGAKTANAQWGSSNNRFYIGITSDGYLTGGISSDGTSTSASATGSVDITGVDHHIALVWKPSRSLELYLDGELHAADYTSIPSALHATTQAALIGSLDGTTQYWDGKIQYVSNFYKALTPSDIKEQATKALLRDKEVQFVAAPKNYPQVIKDAKPTLYYRLGEGALPLPVPSNNAKYFWAINPLTPAQNRWVGVEQGQLRFYSYYDFPDPGGSSAHGIRGWRDANSTAVFEVYYRDIYSENSFNNYGNNMRMIVSFGNDGSGSCYMVLSHYSAGNSNRMDIDIIQNNVNIWNIGYTNNTAYGRWRVTMNGTSLTIEFWNGSSWITAGTQPISITDSQWSNYFAVYWDSYMNSHRPDKQFAWYNIGINSSNIKWSPFHFSEVNQYDYTDNDRPLFWYANSYANMPTGANNLQQKNLLPGVSDSKSVYLDGNHHLLLSDRNITTITGSMSIELAFEVNPSAGSQYLLGKTDQSADKGFSIYVDANEYLNFMVSGDGSAETTVQYASDVSGESHHLIAVYEPSTRLTLYLDGLKVAENTTSIPASLFDAAENIIIGGYGWDTTVIPNFRLGGGYTGYLSEISIFSRAISDAEARQHYESTLSTVATAEGYSMMNYIARDKPVAWFRLRETKSFNVVDESGNYIGSYVNNPTLNQTTLLNSVFYTDDASVSFDGTNDRADFGNVLDFSWTDPFSIEFLFQTGSTPGADAYMLGKMEGTTAYKGWGIFMGTDGKVNFILRNDEAGSDYDDSVSQLPHSQKIVIQDNAVAYNNSAAHHIIVTYDGSKEVAGMRMYIDGNEIDHYNITDDLRADFANTASFNIGTVNDGDSPFTGIIDEVQIYDYALTADQAADHWAGVTYTGADPLVPVYNIRGALTDHTGAPVTGTVRLYLASDGSLVDTQTTFQSTGEFLFKQVTQGQQYILVNYTGIGTIAKSSKIDGLVFDRKGDPRINEILYCHVDSTGAFVATTDTGSGGEFSFTGLTTDVEYRISAARNSGIVGEEMDGSEYLGADTTGYLAVSPGDRLYIGQ